MLATTLRCWWRFGSFSLTTSSIIYRNFFTNTQKLSPTSTCHQHRCSPSQLTSVPLVVPSSPVKSSFLPINRATSLEMSKVGRMNFEIFDENEFEFVLCLGLSTFEKNSTNELSHSGGESCSNLKNQDRCIDCTSWLHFQKSIGSLIQEIFFHFEQIIVISNWWYLSNGNTQAAGHVFKTINWLNWVNELNKHQND